MLTDPGCSHCGTKNEIPRSPAIWENVCSVTDRRSKGRWTVIRFGRHANHSIFPTVAKFVIPRRTVYRLSLYFRIVERLFQNRIDTVSSAALAKAAGVKPTQLRKDLTYFGQFGTRGLGYNVGALSKRLTDVLGTA